MTLNEELDLLVQDLPIVPDSKSYWLVRTQSGRLYETFRENGIVALDHEEVPLSVLNEFKIEAAGDGLALNKLIRKKVSEEHDKLFAENLIKEVTPRNTSLIANQIYKFTFEVKKGDIVIIPSANSDLISFGEVEQDHIAVFNPEEQRKFQIDAVLTKRVKWVKDVLRIELDPYLYRMFTTHQALSDVGGYAEIVERSLRDFFIIQIEVSFPADTLDLIEFLYFVEGIRGSFVIVLQCFIEHTSRMCHTVYQRDARTLVKNILRNISIGLQITLKVFQYFHGSLPAPAFLVIEEDQFVNAVLIYPIKASLGLPLLILIDHLDEGFICMQVAVL